MAFNKHEQQILKELHPKRRLKIFYGILSLQRLGLCEDIIWQILFEGGLVLSLQREEQNKEIAHELKWDAQDFNYSYISHENDWYQYQMTGNTCIINKELNQIYPITGEFELALSRKGHSITSSRYPDKIKDIKQSRLWCHKERFSIPGGNITIFIYTEQQIELDDILEITVSREAGQSDYTFALQKALSSSLIDMDSMTPRFTLIPETTKSYRQVDKQHKEDLYKQNFVIDVYNNMDYKTQRFYQNNFTYIIPKGHYGYNGNQDTRFNIVIDKGNIFMKKY